MTSEAQDLRTATALLPDPVRRAMRLALRSGWYRIEPGSWESATAVCPLAAAAKVAGVWRDGHAADGGALWGDEHEPAITGFAFAVAFDLYAEEAGTDAAIELLLEELDPRSLTDGWLPGFDRPGLAA